MRKRERILDICTIISRITRLKQMKYFQQYISSFYPTFVFVITNYCNSCVASIVNLSRIINCEHRT